MWSVIDKKELFELQVNETERFCVSTDSTITYLFVVVLVVALSPDLEALFDEIFQIAFLNNDSATDFIYVDEEPEYVNVPVTVTGNTTVP